MYTIEELKQQIRAMGIEKDDTVLIHTSMRAIGQVENGADGVIDAFCQVLSDGLFLVPTHTWAVVNRENPVYDVRTTVPNIGALPRTAAFRKCTPSGVTARMRRNSSRVRKRPVHPLLWGVHGTVWRSETPRSF